MLVAVLGYVAHAHYAALTYGNVGYIPAGEGDLAGYGGLKAGKGMDEFGLAVSVNARYADYLACAHLQGCVLYGVVLVYLGGYGKIFYRKDNVAGIGRALFNVKADVAAYHH